MAIRTTGPLGIAQDLSYQFDLVGNLKSRTDSLQAVTETFAYDNINRLTQVSGPAPKTYQYDAIGNITNKSDVGSYTYNASGAGSIRPHAVTQAGTNTYTYDANGNQITGAGRTITYASFNKPSQIVTSTASVSFTYDANQRRMRKVSSQSTTVYLGKLYEKTTSTAGAEHKHYLYAANTLVGIYTQKPDNTTNTRYLHTDHLLSVDTITDEAGNVVQKQSYDAHGKRRNINGLDATTPITAQTTRGFTRHEMDDDVGLINMNAREYDPVLGRFLTPDTFVQYPASTQGYNRYAYVNNNPLSFTDPSGHFLKSISRAVKSVVNEVKRTVDNVTSSNGIRTIVAAVAAYYTFNWASAQATFAAAGTSVSGSTAFLIGDIAGGAAAGFVGGGIIGGNLKSAVYGGVGGGIAGTFAGSGFLGQATGSGINGYLQTGNSKGFLRGFASGAIPQDLGFTNAYQTNPYANVGIGIARDATRGYIVGGREGIVSGIGYGQFNNAIGHLVGFATTLSAPKFGDGRFIYEGAYWSSIPGAITFGNVISGPVNLSLNPGSFLYRHESGHIPQGNLLGALYAPVHALSLSLAQLINGDHHGSVNVWENYLHQTPVKGNSAPWLDNIYGTEYQ